MSDSPDGAEDDAVDDEAAEDEALDAVSAENDAFDAAAVTERVGDAANVLLLAPAMDATADVVCHRHLAADDASVLVVSFTASVDRWAREWRANAGDLPSPLVFVHVGGTVRSAAATSATVAASENQVFETIGDPADLTGLGITMNKHLTQWRNAECRKAVCFRSVTALLQYVDVRTAYRFLQVLTAQVAAAGAVGHYHLSPDAHDGTDVNALVSLFDASITVDDGVTTVATK